MQLSASHWTSSAAHREPSYRLWSSLMDTLCLMDAFQMLPALPLIENAHRELSATHREQVASFLVICSFAIQTQSVRNCSGSEVRNSNSPWNDSHHSKNDNFNGNFESLTRRFGQVSTNDFHWELSVENISLTQWHWDFSNENLHSEPSMRLFFKERTPRTFGSKVLTGDSSTCGPLPRPRMASLKFEVLKMVASNHLKQSPISATVCQTAFGL